MFQLYNAGRDKNQQFVVRVAAGVVLEGPAQNRNLGKHGKGIAALVVGPFDDAADNHGIAVVDQQFGLRFVGGHVGHACGDAGDVIFGDKDNQGDAVVRGHMGGDFQHQVDILEGHRGAARGVALQVGIFQALFDLGFFVVQGQDFGRRKNAALTRGLQGVEARIEHKGHPGKP